MKNILEENKRKLQRRRTLLNKLELENDLNSETIKVNRHIPKEYNKIELAKKMKDKYLQEKKLV